MLSTPRATVLPMSCSFMSRKTCLPAPTLARVVGVALGRTGTGSYTLMDGSAIRTPGTGLWNVNNTNLENYGVPPDIYVDNTPEDFLKGRDAQIEKAVEVLKGQLAQKK